MRKWISLLVGLLILTGLFAPTAAAAPGAVHGAVLDGLGRPIAGAELELYRLGTGLQTVATTDMGGAFRVEAGGLGTGLWQLRVSAKGFRTLETGWVDMSAGRYQVLRLEQLTGDLAVVLRDGSGDPVNGFVWLSGPGGQVSAGEMLSDGRLLHRGLTAGAYKLFVMAEGFQSRTESVSVAPGSTATAVVELSSARIDLAGEVRNAVTGAPIKGAAVALLFDGQTQVATATTGEGGRFSAHLSHGAAGSYRLRATAPGYRAAESAAMGLEPGQSGDFSGGDGLFLEPLYATLTGQVIGLHGNPVDNARLVLHLEGYGEVAVAEAPRGEFRFEQVPAIPGLRWRVTLEDRADPAATAWTEYQSGLHHLVLQQRQSVPSGSGEGALNGVVTDQHGAPLSGVTVEVLRLGRVAHTVTSDDAGSFTVRQLWGTQGTWSAGDPYTLRFSKEGYVATREFSLNGQVQTELQVTDKARPAIRAQLRPEAVDLQGRVLSASGEPVAGAKLSLVADGSGATRTTVTDKSGWYRFTQVALTAGERYSLRVEAGGFWPQSGIDVTDAAFTGRSLPTARLTPAQLKLSGLVTDHRGEPLQGATVTLWGQDGKPAGQSSTDAHGFYRLEAPSADGLKALTASREGYSTALAEVAATGAEGSASIRKDLVMLANAGGLEGRVLSGDGQPISLVRVELLADGQGVVRSTLTDGAGHYAFRDLPTGGSGWYWVRVRPEQGQFGGSLTHQMDLFPQIRLLPGERLMSDLLVR